MGSDPTVSKNVTTSQFATALVFNLVAFVIQVAAFIYLRPRFRVIYEPRSYIPPESFVFLSDPYKFHHLTTRIRKRVPRLPEGSFAWPLAIWRADIEDIKRVNGLDAYFFVRFLRMMALMFLPIWFITWIVLLPLTTVHSQNPGTSGLDRFTFGNVQPTEQTRYAAHIILAWLLTCTSYDRPPCNCH